MEDNDNKVRTIETECPECRRDTTIKIKDMIAVCVSCQAVFDIPLDGGSCSLCDTYIEGFKTFKAITLCKEDIAISIMSEGLCYKCREKHLREHYDKIKKSINEDIKIRERWKEYKSNKGD